LPGPQRRIDLDVEARVAALASSRRASFGMDAVGFGLPAPSSTLRASPPLALRAERAKIKFHAR
jgi:hypothetical protein